MAKKNKKSGSVIFKDGKFSTKNKKLAEALLAQHICKHQRNINGGCVKCNDPSF